MQSSHYCLHTKQLSKKDDETTNQIITILIILVFILILWQVRPINAGQTCQNIYCKKYLQAGAQRGYIHCKLTFPRNP